MRSSIAASRRAALIGIVALASASCSRASGELTVRSPSRLFSARVRLTPDRHAMLAGLDGPLTSAEVYGDELRGTFDGSPVFLTLDEGAMRITGVLGDQPVHLRLLQTGRGLRVSGLFAGSLSDYEIDYSGAVPGLRGKIGHCSYDLRWIRDEQASGYEGQCACSDGRIENVFVHEPGEMFIAGEWLTGLTRTQTVAALALALAR